MSSNVGRRSFSFPSSSKWLGLYNLFSSESRCGSTRFCGGCTRSVPSSTIASRSESDGTSLKSPHLGHWITPAAMSSGSANRCPHLHGNLMSRLGASTSVMHYSDGHDRLTLHAAVITVSQMLRASANLATIETFARVEDELVSPCRSQCGGTFRYS